MNTRRTWTVWLAALAALILPALLAAYGPSSARAEDKSPAPGISLSYDAKSGALLKSDGTGLYRSTDDGQTWKVLPLPTSAKGRPTTVATAAGGSGIVYVAGPGIGVLRSKDGGVHWSDLNEGLPSTDVTALATHATLPDTLYAYLPKNGIYRSQDAGKSWKLMDRGPETTRQVIHTNMKGSMQTGWLYVATAKGVQVSMDCFCLWRDAGGLKGKIYSLAFDSQKPERLYAASEEGLFLSTNGGQEWQPATSPESTATALTVTSSGTVFAASGNGAIFRSDDHAETWERVGG